MTQGQSIANIRLQYSIPANVSDSEIMKFAQDNNIVIDFSGKSNATQATQQAPVKQGDDSLGISLFNTGGSHDIAGASRGESIFGGAQSAVNMGDGAIDGFSIEKTTTPVVQQQVVDTTTFAEWQKKEQTKVENNQTIQQTNVEAQKQALETTQKEEIKTETTSTVSTGAQSAEALKKEAMKAKAQAHLRNIPGYENKEIVKFEVKDGNSFATLDDGTVIQATLIKKDEEGYDPSKHNTKVLHRIYKDGMTTICYPDGQVETRKAIKGEIGYVKDGESIEERLIRFNTKMKPEDFRKLSPEAKQKMVEDFKKLSPEEQQKMVDKYAKYLSTQSNDVRKNDYIKLMRNTDAESRKLLMYLASKFEKDGEYIAAMKEAYGACFTDKAIAWHSEHVMKDGRIQKMSKEDQMSAVGVVSSHLVTEENANSYGNLTRELHEDNQKASVELGYKALENDVTLLSVYRDNVTTNIGGYHKDAQLGVVNISLKYDDENHTGAQNLADHTHETDVDVQKEIAQILLDLQVDSVSGKIASHAYEYDINNRDDIIQMVKDHGTEGAKKILEEATRQFEQETEMKAQYAEKKKAEAERLERLASQQEQIESTQTTQNVQANNSEQQKLNNVTTKTQPFNLAAISNKQINELKVLMQTKTAAQVIKTEEFKSLNINDSIKFLKDLSTSQRKEAVETLCENSQGIELQGYMYSELKKDIINYLVSHPTSKNTSKLEYIQRFLDSDDKQYIEQLKKHQSSEQDIIKTIGGNPFSF